MQSEARKKRRHGNPDHPNTKNHLTLLGFMDKNFKPALLNGDYIQASAAIAEVVQLLLEAQGVPREKHSAIAQIMVQNCVDARTPRPEPSKLVNSSGVPVDATPELVTPGTDVVEVVGQTKNKEA